MNTTPDIPVADRVRGHWADRWIPPAARPYALLARPYARLAGAERRLRSIGVAVTGV